MENSSPETYSWQDASGRWHEFEVARQARNWAPEGGLYMFVKPRDTAPTRDGGPPQWGGPIALFLGKTDNFANSLARHDMWQAAENLGAKEIHLLPIKEAQTRDWVEKDLLEAQCPILNRNGLRRVA
jgi:hypothetical protein